MITNRLVRGFARTSFVLCCCLCSVANAQEGAPPAPEGDPVDASHYEPQVQMQQQTVQGLGHDGQLRQYNIQQRQVIAPSATYRSNSLGGNFQAQWMYITQNNQAITFWGARAVSLDPQSPLRYLGMRAGDVVTRLDGIPIWNQMYRQGQGWVVPELDRHFGTTDVRYILQGTNQVRVGQIVLDNFGTPENGITPLQP